MKPHTLAVLLLIAAPAFAADLGKYAAWGDSPPAYFMTPAERAEWGQVRNEQEAAAFVSRFDERRGPDFEREVAERAKAADERLTVGTTPGARTLRGKIVILLGPPASCSVTQRRKVLRTFGRKFFHPGLPSTEILTSWDDHDIDLSSTLEYRLTYAKATVFIVEVDPVTGMDRISDSRTARRLKELMAAAAEASVVSSTREQRRSR